MTERSALILVGNEERHFETAKMLERYLTDEVRLDRAHVETVPCAWSTDEHILERTRQFFEQTGQATGIVVYLGHGGIGYMAPERERKLSYEDFAGQFVSPGDFFFINAACYSGSAIPPFVNLGLLPKRGLVITAAQEDEATHGMAFVENLIEAYRKREAFRKHHNGKLVEDYIEGYISDIVIIRDENGRVVKFRDTTDERIARHYPKFVCDGTPVRRGKMLDYLLFPA